MSRKRRLIAREVERFPYRPSCFRRTRAPSSIIYIYIYRAAKGSCGIDHSATQIRRQLRGTTISSLLHNRNPRCEGRASDICSSPRRRRLTHAHAHVARERDYREFTHPAVFFIYARIDIYNNIAADPSGSARLWKGTLYVHYKRRLFSRFIYIYIYV